MPILEVEIVVSDEELLDATLASAIADAAGTVFKTPPGRTWVKLRTLALGSYAENDVLPPVDLRPVFISVLKAQRPDALTLQREITELTAAVADLTGRPVENVHVSYLPPGEGRMAFGGKLVPVEDQEAA